MTTKNVRVESIARNVNRDSETIMDYRAHCANNSQCAISVVSGNPLFYTLINK